MKRKRIEWILLSVTAAFALVMIGFFLGRAYSGTVIYMREDTDQTLAQSDPSPVAAADADMDAAVDPDPGMEPLDRPTDTEPSEQSVSTELSFPSDQSGLININTADAAQLETLQGIGPTLAQRIIDYREENGPFQTIEQIKEVKGIGDAKFAAMQDSITVG